MKNIIIIGAGFSGLTVLREIARAELDVNVTIIDKKPTFDFLPMLPDTIGQRIKVENISYDIAQFADKYKSRFIQDEVLEVNLKNNKVKTGSNVLDYDYLVISSGAENNFYGNEQAKENTFKLYSAEDALKILAELKKNIYENYMIVGGGYTGVEIATNIRRFLNKNNKKGDIYILEKADRILGPLSDNLRNYVYKNLALMDINVMEKTGSRTIENGRVVLDNGRELKKTMVFWAPGVKMPDFMAKLEMEKGRQGRLKVDDYLRINDSCFASGDSADVQLNGNTLRMAIMFSLSEGKSVGKNIVRSIKGLTLKKYTVSKDLGYVVPMANNKSCGFVLGKEIFGVTGTFLHYLMCIYRSYTIKRKISLIKDLFSI